MAAEIVQNESGTGRLPWSVAAVFILALATRLLVPVLSTGGLRGLYNYDASVYYSAADAILSGRVPYRDFNLVHPPLLALVLTPFAALGRATTDHTGFVVGNLAFTVLGAVNAVLVQVLCRRLGLGRGPAVFAGVFYAVWFGSVNAEMTMRLEPLGNFIFLVGLIVLLRARKHASAWTAVGAGVLLGLTCTVKIWWLLPIAVILAESLVRRRWRETAAALTGAVCAVLVTIAPFAVLAGHRMYRMVVLAQTDRPRLHGNLAIRVQGFASGTAGRWLPGASATSDLAIATLAVIVLAAVLACRVTAARVFVVVLGVQVIALLNGPSWYPFYDDWLSVAGAVALGAGAHSVAGSDRRSVRGSAWAPAAVVALLCVVTAVNLDRQGGGLIAPFGRVNRLVHVARRYGGCMQADTPMLLIEADALTRSFGRTCRDAVDVSSPRLGIDGRSLEIEQGVAHPAYDRYLAQYLTSGDTAMLASMAGLSPQARRAVDCGGVVDRVGPYRLYRMRACSRRLAAHLPNAADAP